MNPTDPDPAAIKKRFQDEETVRLALQVNGAIHDCTEAGCIKDPQGGDPKVTGKAKRPARDKSITDLQTALKSE